MCNMSGEDNKKRDLKLESPILTETEEQAIDKLIESSLVSIS